ncbi:MoaD/ThiS family protein [Jeongeupia naejangsanensis]|uniref:MoaD/ThiS family protein n=1 Tax=Jeongeupia naejangsanensis TaxID=613195 RepID=A0ABS2BPT7_9NEIS|nr:MoaD/ThiS family protein [Jeongeupia naejangsanensis]MBM3117038.1 MoaD/ThiS family protein [Jeongeupia naejangsanensis]
MSVVHINLPVPLRKLAKGATSIECQANTVLDALLKLDEIDASISARLLEDDRSALKRYINVYVDGKHISKTGGLQTTLANSSKLEIVTAFAGG